MVARTRTLPRKQPVQERARATVDAILDATAHVLVKHGYDHASTNRIAAEAGVSIGSLYQYFPSKEALVAALMDRHSNEMFEVLRTKMALVADSSIAHAAHEIVGAMVAAHAVDPKLHRVLIEQVPRIGRLARMEDVEQRASVMLHAFLESRRHEIRPKNLDLAVFVVIGIVESLTHVAVLQRPELLGELGSEIADVVIQYLTRESVSTSAGVSTRRASLHS